MVRAPTGRPDMEDSLDGANTQPPGSSTARTHFAPAERRGREELERQARDMAGSPIMQALLAASGGLLAVINEQRQIVTLNSTLLEALGIDDAGEALGLRPGEALGCVHADDNLPGGCGTGRWCSSCGAAIAIVASLAEDRTVERICTMQTTCAGVKQDLFLSVRAHPLRLDGARWVLLYLQDVSAQQELALLQRVFFHDVANLVTALVGHSQVLEEDVPPGLREQAGVLARYAARLAREVALQRLLFQADAGAFEPRLRPVAAREALAEAHDVCRDHTAARDRRIHAADRSGGVVLQTDPVVLNRVLTNMLVNALEATPPGGAVEAWCELDGDGVVFRVRNPGQVRADVARRVFERNFSTRGGPGRGLGTHSMKLFGEQILGGQVSFVSQGGHTVFQLRLPRAGE